MYDTSTSETKQIDIEQMTPDQLHALHREERRRMESAYYNAFSTLNLEEVVDYSTANFLAQDSWAIGEIIADNIRDEKWKLGILAAFAESALKKIEYFRERGKNLDDIQRMLDYLHEKGVLLDERSIKLLDFETACKNYIRNRRMAMLNH